MKLVFASDSFKGSLSAVRIAELLREEAQAAFPGCETVCLPVADGGEGTVDALFMGMPGLRWKQFVRVTGPDRRPVDAWYCMTEDGTAVLEMAAASGLPLMQAKNPLHATSRGTGEMLASVLRQGARNILLGIGGSATNDGG